MKTTKWLTIGAAVIAASAGLMLKGADPATSPGTPPATVAAPAVKPAASTPPAVAPTDNSNNNNTSRRGNFNSGNGRGGRGNRNGNRGDIGTGSGTSGNDPFAVLQARSIFVKGNQNVAADPRPVQQYVPQGAMVGKKESMLVFNGVIIVNDEADALVEDLDTHDVVKVRTGDGIAGGRVSGISFDDLAYTANGRTLHVAIGQNLEGVTAAMAPLPPPAVAVTAPPTTAPTEAGAIPAAPPAVPGGAATITVPGTPGETSKDDIIARMKARRAAGQ